MDAKNNFLDDFDVDFDEDDVEEEEIDFGTSDDTIQQNNSTGQYESDNQVYTEESSDEQEDNEDLEDSDNIDDNEDIEDNDDIDNNDDIDDNEDNNSEDEEQEAKLQNNNGIQPLVLYILTDKPVTGMLSYFRGYGANVSKIFSNINEARDTLLMQVEPSRVVIIDTGTGRFTNMASRNALIDMIGICDEDTKISVFYTDTIIKHEIEDSDEIEAKMIQWNKYRSTADVLANLLQKSKSEEYVFDMEDKDEDISVKTLNITGLKVECPKQIDIGLPVISIDDLKAHMVNNPNAEDTIPGYVIKI